MKEPLVSVVIPFYSGIVWLEEALESVIAQTYKNTEILVVNDGSKEDLSAIKKKYNQIVNFTDQKNGGPAAARNKGVENTKGEYIAFLDSDDLWFPEKLKKQISYMENNNYMWSQHSYEMFWDNSGKTKIIYTDNLYGEVLKRTYISFKVQTSCVVVRRDVLEKNSIKFPVNKRYGQDMVFFRELAVLYELGYVDGVFSKFRIRGSNAGFRAKIQLADKASIWNEIKSDKNILNLLPLNVIIAYKLIYLINPIITRFDKIEFINEKIVEFFAKAFYLIPYLLVKANKEVDEL